MKRTGARPKDGRLLNVQKRNDEKLSPSVFYGIIGFICNFSEAGQRGESGAAGKELQVESK